MAKRVFLRQPSDPARKLDGSLFVDEGLLRAAAVALVRYATDNSQRQVGDQVVERVTEGRLSANLERRSKGSKELPYSCCGDEPHWMLRCLGCRDEKIVNRSDDGGDHPWATGVNIGRLGGSGLVVQAKALSPERPGPGCPIFINNRYGGHVCVVEAWDESSGKIVTHDYGQGLPAVARRRERTITHYGQVIYLDSDPLVWWLPIDRVPLMESAIVPDDFEGGVEDENPYPEFEGGDAL